MIAPFNRFYDRDPGPNKANTMRFLCVIIKTLKVLAVCPHIHVENGTVKLIPGMFFCDNRLFYGSHTANR